MTRYHHNEPPGKTWKREIAQLFTERCIEEQERLEAEYDRLYAGFYRTFPANSCPVDAHSFG